MLEVLEKKELKIFTIMLVLTTFIMGFTLKWAYNLKLDGVLGNLVAVQMLMPGFSVFIAQVLTSKKEEILFKFSISYIIFTIISYIIMLFGVILKNEIVNDVFALFIFVGHLAIIASYFMENKELRNKNKFTFINKKSSFLYIGLFILIFAMRTGLSYFADKTAFLEMMSGINYILLIILIPNYFLSFAFFFGEEYGWRYFLQPKLQKLFGKRVGVLILGFIWGIWHIFISLYFYSPETFLQQAIVQVVFCIAIGIFMGLAYMVTENIWVPTIIHYLNNNLAGVLTGGELSNQVLSWSDALIGAGINLIFFGVFIFAKKYNDNKKLVE